MPPPLGLVNLSVGDLIAAAGGDPWKINDELQAGDPGAINAQADAFHAAAGSATEVEDDFKLAKQRFEKGWKHSGSEHPINESAQVTQATTTMHMQKFQLGKTALDLESVAGALATAQLNAAAVIGGLDTNLHAIDDAMGIAKANNQDTKALHDEAVEAVKSALDQVKGDQKAYASVMAAAKPSMSTVAGEVPQATGKPGPANGAGPNENSDPWWKVKQPGPADVAVGGAGAVSGITADGVRGAVLDAIKDGPKTGPGAADPALLKWLEAPDSRFLKGFSKLGGVAALVGVIPSIASDMKGENGKPGNSFAEAAVREVGGAAAGMATGAWAGAGAAALTDMAVFAAAGSVVPGVGTVVGLGVGAVVGAYVACDGSKYIAKAWDWAAPGVEHAASSLVHGVESIFSW
jgi:hypothetical protein